jgi:hypothetical protein
VGEERFSAGVAHDIENRTDFVVVLEKQLDQTRTERKAHEAAISVLAEKEEALKRLILIEIKASSATASNGATLPLALEFRAEHAPHDEPQSLSDIILDALEGTRGMTLGEIVHYARRRGYSFDDKMPGRVVHFGLVGLKQAGKVTRSDDGVWARTMT